MPFVITEPCIDVKDAACVVACPVDCIYEGPRMLYIHPAECIDCAACVPVCPVNAIYWDDDVPFEWTHFIDVNASFFGREVTSWGSPGGADSVGKSSIDHPLVAAAPKNGLPHITP